MMIPLSPSAIWQLNEKELLKILDKEMLPRRRKEIRFYAPSFTHYKTSHYCSSSDDFPTISVTGTGCALNCKHCGGKVLNTMHAATTPEKLFKICKELKEKNAKGCLLSGGCLPDGTVPLAKFVDTIKKIKQQLRLTVFVHTGIINSTMANALRKAGVDAALIDVIGSDETIREIYNLKITLKDYADSLQALSASKIPFVPHVIVGLHYGKLKGEQKALQIISQHAPSALVIIAFMPIRKTEMEKVKPPKPYDIARVLMSARVMFPSTPLVLGCMRARDDSRSETEILAIKAGVDAIAFPTEEAIELAESCGLQFSFSPYCCSQVYLDSRT
jgi:lipoyl synthase